MTITCQEKSYHNGWKDVISDAEEEIADAKKRIAALRASIVTFRQKMNAGEPLPEGLEKREAGTAVESAPAKG